MLFTTDPSQIGTEIESQCEEVIKYMMNQAWWNLTLPASEGGTPRDTTFASSSWILSIGQESSDVAGEKKAVNRSAAIAGVQALRSYRLAQGAVFLVNNSKYITKLNAGWSPQAEPGFVDAAVLRAQTDTEAKFNQL